MGNANNLVKEATLLGGGNKNQEVRATGNPIGTHWKGSTKKPGRPDLQAVFSRPTRFLPQHLDNFGTTLGFWNLNCIHEISSNSDDRSYSLEKDTRS